MFSIEQKSMLYYCYVTPSQMEDKRSTNEKSKKGPFYVIVSRIHRVKLMMLDIVYLGGKFSVLFVIDLFEVDKCTPRIASLQKYQNY